MGQQYEHLNIKERKTIRGRTSRNLRKEGMIPANFYYKGEENKNISVEKNSFLKLLRAGHRIFEVEMDGGEQYVMVKELQYHPVTDDIIHIDLLRVRRDEKMTISVQLVLEGTPEGVKEGGIMAQNLSTIEISCLPADVPEQVIVDVTSLELQGNLYVEDIVVSDKLEVLTSGDISIASCQLPKEETEVETDDVEELEGDQETEGDQGEEKSKEEKSSD